MARTRQESSRREALLVVMLTRILEESGRGDWIRTSDPLRPRQVRYQAALRPDSDFLGFYRARTPDPTSLSQNCRNTRACLKTPIAPNQQITWTFQSLRRRLP